MRMRFWGENTRETGAAEGKRLSARAFHPKARSHRPITVPDGLGQNFCAKRLTSISATSNQANFCVAVIAYLSARRISRVMRFAEVKEETAQRAEDTQQSVSPG